METKTESNIKDTPPPRETIPIKRKGVITIFEEKTIDRVKITLRSCGKKFSDKYPSFLELPNDTETLDYFLDLTDNNQENEEIIYGFIDWVFREHKFGKRNFRGTFQCEDGKSKSYKLVEDLLEILCDIELITDISVCHRDLNKCK